MHTMKDLLMKRIDTLIKMMNEEKQSLEVIGTSEQPLYGKIKNPYIPIRVNDMSIKFYTTNFNAYSASIEDEVS